MDLTSSIWGFVQAPIIHILRERMKNRDSIKKLLQNKDAMEDVIRGLTEMLDQLERRVSSPGIENSTKTELFNKLEKSVRELHASMQEIKEAYRNSQTGVRFFLKSMKGYCRDRVHRKLRDQFEDVVEAIDHMESCERLMWVEGFLFRHFRFSFTFSHLVLCFCYLNIGEKYMLG